jgi:hypothetical protein
MGYGDRSSRPHTQGAQNVERGAAPLVVAKLDKKHYETGKKISDEEMDQLNIKYDKVNP